MPEKKKFSECLKSSIFPTTVEIERFAFDVLKHAFCPALNKTLSRGFLVVLDFLIKESGYACASYCAFYSHSTRQQTYITQKRSF